MPDGDREGMVAKDVAFVKGRVLLAEHLVIALLLLLLPFCVGVLLVKNALSLKTAPPFQFDVSVPGSFPATFDMVSLSDMSGEVKNSSGIAYVKRFKSKIRDLGGSAYFVKNHGGWLKLSPPWFIYENGKQLTEVGKARWVTRHKGACFQDDNGFYFSASDNSDPRTNGRTYHLVTQRKGLAMFCSNESRLALYALFVVAALGLTHRHREYLQLTSVGRVCRGVGILLVPFLAVVFVQSTMMGDHGLIPKLRFYPDSSTYLAWSYNPELRLFNLIVPFCYPLFLAVVKQFSPFLAWVPAIQLAVFLFATLVLALALRKSGMPKIAAVAAVVPLACYRPLFDEFHAAVLTESLCASLLILMLAFLLFALHSPERKALWAWALTGVCCFLAYQTRPAVLVVVVLVPVWACCFYLIRYYPCGKPRLLWLMWRLAAITALTASPCLLFCGYRYVQYDQFNITPLGGKDLLFTTGQLLRVEDLPRLPVETRPLAEKLLEQMRASGFRPISELSGREFYRQGHEKLYYTLQRNAPVPQRAALARAILKLRTGDYLDWVWLAMCDGKEVLMRDGALKNVYPWPLLALLVPMLGLSVAALRRHRRHGAVLSSIYMNLLLRPALFLAIVAVSFFLCSTLLVVCVEMFTMRYSAICELLIPMAFWGVAALYWCQLWAVVMAWRRLRSTRCRDGALVLAVQSMEVKLK